MSKTETAQCICGDGFGLNLSCTAHDQMTGETGMQMALRKMRANVVPDTSMRVIAEAFDGLLDACNEIIEGMVDGPNRTQKNVTSFAIHKVQAAIQKAEGRA